METPGDGAAKRKRRDGKGDLKRSATRAGDGAGDDHDQQQRRRPVDQPAAPSRAAALVGRRGVAQSGGDTRQGLVFTVAGTGGEVREDVPEVIQVVAPSGDEEAGEES